MKTIHLAGGCFWGLQQFLDQFDGVLATETGYANGPDRAPTYEEVCADSGHAETVRVEYDESRIGLAELLGRYFMVIDPFSMNRQGGDAGIQYRTGIYYTDEADLPVIREACARVEREAGSEALKVDADVGAERGGAAGEPARPLAVEICPLVNFFPAEEYHQKYLEKHPGGYCHIPARFMHLEG
ncbi:MAG: peptide-methionine (S)-S-oxide reductase MsrA [Lachnospiraceae bacterium]|nr:peptide-methionine (S)-S-oxide reductase MsrA [Lachnospiraceae bacterium]